LTAYETQVNRNYFQYFQLLGVGTVVAGQYLLNDAKVGAYRLQAKAQLCAVATQNSLPCAAGDPTDQQVKDYAASLYTTSVAFLQNGVRCVVRRDDCHVRSAVRLSRHAGLAAGSGSPQERPLDGERAPLRNQPPGADCSDGWLEPGRHDRLGS